MRLLTFHTEYGLRLGALMEGDEFVLDLNRACEVHHADLGHGKPRAMADAFCPTSMVEFLRGGDEAMDEARRLLAAFTSHIESPRARKEVTERRIVLPRRHVRLAAPVPRPGKIPCLGLNYRDHAAESAQKVPEVPVIFTKPPDCVIGPGDLILLPRVAPQQVDYEIEFAFVMGRRAKDVPEDRALEYVAGYTIFHDVSARDYQLRTSQWYIGKAFDTFGPMGPYLVTRDEVPDPHALDVTLRLNGKVMQQSNTKNLVFGVPALVAYLSEVMTLEPGDVIATGTPGGVGIYLKPPRYLRPGDVCALEIERLGILENPVAAA